jgi:hypothetical protein
MSNAKSAPGTLFEPLIVTGVVPMNTKPEPSATRRSPIFLGVRRKGRAMHCHRNG